MMKETEMAKEDFSAYMYRFSWYHLIRPMTLTGTITPVLAGTALAGRKTAINWKHLLLLLAAAVLVQAAVNIWNDYFDFKHGQDQEKWQQGHTGSPGKGLSFRMVPILAAAVLFAACLLGAILASLTTYWVIAAGITGILAGAAYSAGPRPLSSVVLGEVTAAVFLGLVPVSLAYIIQTGSPGLRVFAVSVPFALLIATMILANNIRDIDKDKKFRLTLPMVLGRAKAAFLLAALLLSAYLTVAVLIYSGIIPWTAAASFLAVPVALRLYTSFRPGAARWEEIEGMKWAAKHHWTFGLLFAAGTGWPFG